MSWLKEFLHPGRAYQVAGQELTNAHNNANATRQPWINQGQQSWQTLQDQMSKLNDPAKLQDEWSNSYKNSDYAKSMLNDNLTQGQDAASSMGLGGSSAALQNIQRGAGDIVAKDKHEYMQDLMQKYLTSIGIGTNTYNTGANIANSGAQGEEQYGENQAGLKYGEHSAGGSFLSNLIGQIVRKYAESGK